MKCSQVGLARLIGPSLKDLGSKTDFSSSTLTLLALTVIVSSLTFYTCTRTSETGPVVKNFGYVVTAAAILVCSRNQVSPNFRHLVHGRIGL